MNENIPEAVYLKIWRTFPEAGMGYHLVTLVLRDGSKRKNQVITSGGEVWRGEPQSELDFAPSEVVDAIRQLGTESDAETPWWKPNGE